MHTLADRFRRWYAHERDCNAKIVQMLSSVPQDKRGTPEFVKALDRATKWSESVPGSVQRLYYDLLALEAQKIVADGER